MAGLKLPSKVDFTPLSFPVDSSLSNCLEFPPRLFQGTRLEISVGCIFSIVLRMLKIVSNPTPAADFLYVHRCCGLL